MTIPITSADDGPTLVGIFAAAVEFADLDPSLMAEGAIRVDEAISEHTPDEQVQILAFALMCRLGIEWKRSN